MRDQLPEVFFDVIFHLAGQASIPNSFLIPEKTMDTNVMGTVRILDLARVTGARVVYAGSSSFYGDPKINPYAFSKWLGEETCKMYNVVYKVSTVIARFFNVFGKNQRKGSGVVAIFEEQKRNNQPLTVTGTGEQRRDFISVDDIADGLIAMSTQNWNGEVFNLGCGENFSINEVAEMFKSHEIKHIPARPGEMLETLADINETKEKLNWCPTRSLKTYVQEFINAD